MRAAASRIASSVARRRRGSELNVVSLIDVMIVLVFFLLLQTIDITSFDVTAPSRQSTSPPSPEVPLSVAVTPLDVSVTLGNSPAHIFERHGENYDLAGLQTWLTQIKRAAPTRTDVIVLSAPGLPYGDLVPVLDAVRGTPVNGTDSLFPNIALGSDDAATSRRD